MLVRLTTSICLSLFVIGIFAQEPLKHERKIYVSPEKRVYVNKAQPIYFKISLSADDNGQTYTLPSEQTPKYANPMYIDAEGLNTLRSPYAVDPATKKIVEPKRDVLFDLYADGIAPVTKIKFINTGKHMRNGIIYYGRGLKSDFIAKDEMSGVEGTYVSLDKAVYQDITKSQTILDQEKEYIIAYYSVDHVGNVETPKTEKFSIDLSAPITSFTIIGESKGKVLSSKAAIGLTAKDTLSGVAKILYSINDGPEKVYTTPIPMAVLKDGKSKINYYAIDNVGNKEEMKVISASTEAIEDKTDMTTFSFYIDKEPPVISSEVIGDQYKGKYFYISKNSQFKINANDEKSGVAKIMYSINNPSLNMTYNDPFPISGNGMHTVYFAAVDNVGNLALAQSQQVYVDKHIPSSRVAFQGKQFVNRDTLFITGNTKISIVTNEIGAGIQKVEYMLDGNKAEYSAPITMDKAGFYTIEYLAKDNVNNTESTKKCSFFVDNTSPKIIYNFSTKAIGEKSIRDQKYVIYPSNVMLYIAATDNAAGVESLIYKVNGKEAQSTIPLKDFIPGNYEIEIVASDVLKNKSTETIRFAIEN